MNQPTNSEPTEPTPVMTGPGEVGWSCAAAIRGSDGTPRNSGGGHGWVVGKMVEDVEGMDDMIR